MSPAPPPDEALAAWVARGESDAFDALYRRHAPWVRAWAAHALGAAHADDALQDIFIRVWRAAPQYDPARGRFATWLASITRHHVSRQLSKRGGEHRALAAASVLAALDADADGAGEAIVLGEQVRLVIDALRELPEEQRLVIVLAYFAGMSQSQLAEHLGVPLGTVKSRVRLAMQKLRQAVAMTGPEGRRLRMVKER